MSVSPRQRDIANALYELSDRSFAAPVETTDYLVLQEEAGSSANKKNKNAVSVLENRVTFMVADWQAEDEARRLGISTSRNEELKRLRFPGLTPSTIAANADFFRTLLHRAQQESRNRQAD